MKLTFYEKSWGQAHSGVEQGQVAATMGMKERLKAVIVRLPNMASVVFAKSLFMLYSILVNVDILLNTLLVTLNAVTGVRLTVNII